MEFYAVNIASAQRVFNSSELC